VAGACAGAVVAALDWRTACAASWAPYERAIVIDGLGGPGRGSRDGATPLTADEIADVRRSGMTCAHLTVGTVGTMPTDSAFAQAVESVARWEDEIDRHAEVFARIRTHVDIPAAKDAGRLGLIYGLQDGVSFEANLDRLAVLHRLGIRVIQPTYNRRNLLGDGCLEPADAGLSRAGAEAVERMNDLGILVDLSHCGRRTAADAIRRSTRPVAFTHTGCAALADHPRNRTDDELKAVADRGGVAGIYVMPYLNDGHQPTAAHVLRHVEHAIDVAGEDHVCVGTDGGISPEVADGAFRRAFAETTRARQAAGIAAPGETEDGYLFADDLNLPRRFEILAALLSQRGHSDTRIEKILGANLERVFTAAWTI